MGELCFLQAFLRLAMAMNEEIITAFPIIMQNLNQYGIWFEIEF